MENQMGNGPLMGTLMGTLMEIRMGYGPLMEF
jgi:hypothetical protein